MAWCGWRDASLPFRGSPACRVRSLWRWRWSSLPFRQTRDGHRFYGLVATIVFGVSLKYNQAATWYSASFLTLMLVTLLLALLSAQNWRQNRPDIVNDLVHCLGDFSAAWFPSGILAGLWCFLYLAPQEDELRPLSWRERSMALLPFLGTLAYLAISLPQNLDRLFVAKRIGGQN